MHARFSSLLKANRLDCLPGQLSKGLDLGSLRAGDASWLIIYSENLDLIRRRGRWLTNKIMEIYVQETSAVQFLSTLPAESKRFALSGIAIFPWILAQAFAKLNDSHFQAFAKLGFPNKSDSLK